MISDCETEDSGFRRQDSGNGSMFEISTLEVFPES
jgi:hypothetical protein